MFCQALLLLSVLLFDSLLLAAPENFEQRLSQQVAAQLSPSNELFSKILFRAKKLNV